MRRLSEIVRATALEMLSEPLSLLLLLAALVLAVLAPVLHYHQFGEPTRMARDAGFSSLFLSGMVFAVVGTIRLFRREIESGTIQMALVHPVSRAFFFGAKLLGAVLSYALFALIVWLTSVVVVNGAAIGGEISVTHGDLARLWGPSLALGVLTLTAPLAGAALLNRFWGFRFVLTAFLLALLCALSSIGYRFSAALFLRLLPVAVLTAAFTVFFQLAAAAAAVRLKTNMATAAMGAVMAGALPLVGNYYLPETLGRGGSLPWSYVGLAILVLLPAAGAFLLAGVLGIKNRDFG